MYRQQNAIILRFATHLQLFEVYREVPNSCCSGALVSGRPGKRRYTKPRAYFQPHLQALRDAPEQFLRNTLRQ